MTSTACVISHLSLELNQGPLFQDLNFQLPLKQFSALIGRNGQGKSLLLSRLAENPDLAVPFRGDVHWQVDYATLSQLQRISGQSIADALGVTALAQCFARIEQGLGEVDDFNQVEGLWHLPAQWQQMLSNALLPTELDFPIAQLSEGQKTKLALCQRFQLKDHYLLLDEPSNHLDHAGRQWLIQQILQHPMGCLVVSHDRELLQHAEQIYHLDAQSIQRHSGNYADYMQQHQRELNALQQRVAQDKRELKQTQLQQQQSMAKAASRQQTGEKIRKSGSQAKILLDFKKEQAQHSSAGLATQFHKQLQSATASLAEHQQQLDKTKAQRFELGFARSAHQGEILRLTRLTLPHIATQSIDFALSVGEKLHLVGANGIGKSSLLQLIHHQLPPAKGEIFKATASLYLDQRFSFLNTEQNAIDNLSRLHPALTELEYRRLLGQLRLKGDKGLLPLKYLSGGEQLKVALLAISQMSADIGLLLLDEPENHLDIESRQLLADAIAVFPGTVILVSHDRHFVAECGIEQSYEILSY
ncbi:ATPase subunit of ABC transporter with duplicated ATPase domains [Acinetobacter calcoaceticus]|uniref:ATPase subunit of ABC transporter with duplicated ATPase domains n=1 Tax=Acinetobacter calcoaceticus TaxID=471 RepID=A0A4R1X9A6_ACICA|nr:ATPase subunit of ABC transporter with duplicated ATPase domains [Acinetobacter calcoaceticus]